MNEYIALVDNFKIPAERYRAMATISGARGARESRGRRLSPDKIEALIWGLYHNNAAVRRCCLELLDQHPSTKAVPHIVAKFTDPVPRVRRHAVHAIRCDVCKAGNTILTPDLINRLREMADTDPSPKVRAEAAYGLAEAEPSRAPP